MLYIKRNRKKAPPFMFLLALDKTTMNQKERFFLLYFSFSKNGPISFSGGSKTNINYHPSSL
jgi:hypothetical protein